MLASPLDRWESWGLRLAQAHLPGETENKEANNPQNTVSVFISAIIRWARAESVKGWGWLVWAVGESLEHIKDHSGFQLNGSCVAVTLDQFNPQQGNSVNKYFQRIWSTHQSISFACLHENFLTREHLYYCELKFKARDFPGIQWLSFHCRGPGLDPWSGKLRFPHATWHGQK